MKQLQIILFTLMSSLILGGVHAEHVSDPKLIAEGAKVYGDNCGRCHNPIPASNYSKMEWSVIIPHMREKAHMTGEESLAVEAFLASTLTADVRNEMKDSMKEQPQRTPQELISQFACQGCHSISGVGGNLGPALDGIIKDKGKEFFVKKLIDPKFNNASSAMPQYPMSQDDIDILIKYFETK